MTDDEIRALHAALVLEEAHMHIRYGRRENLSGVHAAAYWDQLVHEIRDVEVALTRRGLEPTP